MHPRAERPAPGVAPGEAINDDSFAAPFERLFAATRRMANAYGTLAVLDVRRAALQFAWLVAGGILISVLVVTAWLTGVLALAVWLLGEGMSWPAVLLIAGALNIAGAVLVALRLKRVFEHVPFSATLRQLRSEESANANNGGDIPS